MLSNLYGSVKRYLLRLSEFSVVFCKIRQFGVGFYNAVLGIALGRLLARTV